MDLKGKVAIVTGSSSGIGASTALAVARRGGSVVVNYSRSRDAADAVAAECRKLGGDAIVVAANVADDADCRVLADAAMKQWGRIDWLVNNAGTTRFVQIRNMAGISAEDFHAIYAVNVIGAFQMVRACETALRGTRRRGQCVVDRVSGRPGLVDRLCVVQGRTEHAHHRPGQGTGPGRASTPCCRASSKAGGCRPASATPDTVRDNYKSQAALGGDDARRHRPHHRVAAREPQDHRTVASCGCRQDSAACRRR
jgi:NAD(P)-dependent dehydrogenase (short-subunit alcohol dehydrogenase family)